MKMVHKVRAVSKS